MVKIQNLGQFWTNLKFAFYEHFVTDKETEENKFVGHKICYQHLTICFSICIRIKPQTGFFKLLIQKLGRFLNKL